MEQKITGTKVDEVRKQIQGALDAMDSGMVVLVGAAKYSSSSITFTVELSQKNDDGVVLNREHNDFLLYAERHGLKKTDINREFFSQGQQFKIIGFARRNRKLPIIAVEIGTGRRYKFTVKQIIYYMQNTTTA